MEKELIGPLKFKGSDKELSLGVEMELQVLDGNTLLLTPQAATIIDLCDTDNIVPEFFQSTLEIVTGICQNVHEVQADLRPSIYNAYLKANQSNLKLGSTGTHPAADYRDRLVTPS